MTPRSNIRPFRPRQPDATPAADWRSRVWAALGYFLLAQGVMTFGLENGLTLLFVVGLLYWAFVHQRRFDFSSFLRFHFLQALVGFLVLLLGLLLLSAFANVLISGLALAGLSPWGSVLRQGWFWALNGAMQVGYWGGGAVLALAALLGKKPELPWIAETVRRLA